MRLIPQAWWRTFDAWLVRIRLRHWVHFLVLPFASYHPFRAFHEQLFGLLRGVCISFSVLTFGYLLNAVSDRDMDLDPEKNVLRGSSKKYHGELIFWSLLALLLAATGPWPVFAATLSCLLCGWVYSSGPRLKALPLVGTLLNVGNFSPLLFVGLHSLPWPSVLPWIVVLFSFLLLQNQLLHEAADAEEDRHGHLNTTFLKWGLTFTVAFTALCGIGVVSTSVYALLVHHRSVWFAFHSIVYVLLFPLWVWSSKSPKSNVHTNAVHRIRKIHRWCCLVSGALMYVVLYGIF